MKEAAREVPFLAPSSLVYQRVSGARSFSNRLFPNRTGTFQRIRATHGIVWRETTDFTVFGNAFHCFFQHDSFLLVLIRVPRRDRHPPPSLSRHPPRHVSRSLRTPEKDHRI